MKHRVRLDSKALCLVALLSAGCGDGAGRSFRLEVIPAQVTLPVGRNAQLTALAIYDDGEQRDLTGVVSWSSEFAPVAGVGNAPPDQGLVTGHALGFATVRAVHPNGRASDVAAVAVTAPVLDALELSPLDPAIALGTAAGFTALGLLSDGSKLDLTDAVDWTSSDPGVATVGNAPLGAGQALGAGVGTTTIAATEPASGIGDATTLTVTDAVLESLAVTPAAATLALGTSLGFSAIGSFSDGTTQDLTDAVVWGSSDSAIVQVSTAAGSAGHAKGVGLGPAAVFALEPASGLHGSATLTITDAVLISIEVTPPDPTLALGTGLQLGAIGHFSDGTLQDLTDAVQWSSSDDLVATVGNAPAGAGLATALALGKVTVGALDSASAVSGATTLTVSDAVVVALGVTPASASIAAGTELQYTATAVFSDGTTQDLTDAVTWSSSDESVATVGNAPGGEGLARGVAPGTSLIAALDPASGVLGFAPLVVSDAVLVSLDVAPVDPSLALGTGLAFTATGTFSDGSTQDLTSAATWSSSDGAVAAVSNAPESQGQALGLSLGVTTIGALEPSSGIGGASTLNVTGAVLLALEVEPANPSLALGTSLALGATGTFSDGTTQDLTDSVAWSSSNAFVAALGNAPGNHGLATALATGWTSVTALEPASGVDGSTTLTVTAAALVSLAVTPLDAVAALGQGVAFTATGTFSDGSTQDLTAQVTWSSSDPTVASISNAPGSQGLASSLALGSTTITALDPASGVGGASSLFVTPAVLESLAVAPADSALPLGLGLQYAAIGTFSDGSVQDLTDAVTWGTSDSAVASISTALGSQGLATALSTGVATISALELSSGLSDSTPLTVTPAVLVSIDVAPADSQLAQGESQAFTALGTYSDGTTQNLTDSVAWSSSDTAVATIASAPASAGLATGVAPGTTTITALDSASGISGATSLGVFPDVALRGAQSSGAASGVLGLAVALPAGTQPGDVLVAAVAVRPASAVITPPAGWTLVRRTDNAAGPTNSLAVYVRTAVPGEASSHAWSFSTSTGSVGAIAAFSGADGSSPVDVESGQATPSSLTHATPSVTTSVARTMLVTLHDLSSSATWTPPAGMSEDVDVASAAVPAAGGIALTLCHALQVASGPTGAKSAVASNDADAGNAAILALRRAP